MSGYVCHTHFEMLRIDRERSEREQPDCQDCIQAKQDAKDRVQIENTIDPKQEYGKHIGLICMTCGAAYNTKNIDYIGARTIFGADCGHPVSDLRVAPR